MIEPLELHDGQHGYWDQDEWRPVVATQDVLPGWKPVGLWTEGVAPLKLLFWDGPQGAVGIWYLGADDQVLAHRLSGLSPDHRVLVAPLLGELSLSGAGLTRFSPPRPGPEGLESSQRWALAEDWLAASQGRLVISTLDEATAYPHLSRTLNPSLTQIVRDAGELSLAVPDPVTGDLVRIDHVLCLDDFRTLCLLPGHTDIYLCRAGHKASFVALYDAAANTLFVGTGDAGWLAPHAFRSVEAELVRHFGEYQDVLPDYLARTGTRLTSIMRYPPHLGHQLYNELGALDGMLSAHPGLVRPPAVMLLGSDGAEVYGPLERLFPEMEGCVLRRGADWRRAAYQEGLCATRLTVEHVSAGLRGRLSVAAASSDAMIQDRKKAAEIKSSGAPVIILGLRVENRTVKDLAGFLKALVSEIRSTWANAIIIIDGHNRRHAETDEVFTSGLLCRRDPYQVEREIVAEVRAHCEEIGLELIDLVGAVMDRSVFWSNQATVFVAPWGAGLAKYRWIANCPGVVLSNSWNAKHRSDFDIYTAPEFMENPSPVLLIAPDKIVDDPNTGDLVMLNPPDQPVEGALNFTVAVADVIPLLRELMPPSKGPRIGI